MVQAVDLLLVEVVALQLVKIHWAHQATNVVEHRTGLRTPAS